MRLVAKVQYQLAQGLPVAGSFAVVHERRDELLVGGHDEVDAVTELGDVAQHLDAAVASVSTSTPGCGFSNAAASLSNGTMRLPA